MLPIPTPFRVPGETLGYVRVAASSTLHPFLEVLLGTWRFGASVRGGKNPEGAAVASHLCFVELPLLAFISSFFFFLGLMCSLKRSSAARGILGIIIWHTGTGVFLARSSRAK